MRPAKKAAERSRARPGKALRTPAVASEHLLAPGELRRIAERIFKLSDADETEVSIEAASDALTRFANNTIHQNVAEQSLVISVRTVFDGRTARASTNKADDDSLRRVVEASSRLARSQPRNPDLLSMAGPQKYEAVDRFFEATAAATPVDRASAVARIVAKAAKAGQTAAGIFSTGVNQSALANSKGLFACYQQTRAEFSITIMEQDSPPPAPPGASGWAKASGPDVAQIHPDALAETASRKTLLSRAPREIEPGRYTVILEPAAALDLLGSLFYDFAGTAVLDKRSCLSGRTGKQIFGENITLWDDVRHPLQLGPPYDGEGLPRQKVLLVDRGVPRNLVYARATAQKMNTQPTGHGLPLPNEWGEAPVNLVFAGGPASLEAMVSSVARGVLITRFWYIREVDPYEKIMTGMTRDATFLIEEGRIVGGIRNFRFNQSLIELLANVEMLGPAVRAAGEESFEMVVPAMKVRNFHFTEVTKY